MSLLKTLNHLSIYMAPTTSIWVFIWKHFLFLFLCINTLISNYDTFTTKVYLKNSAKKKNLQNLSKTASLKMFIDIHLLMSSHEILQASSKLLRSVALNVHLLEAWRNPLNYSQSSVKIQIINIKENECLHHIFRRFLEASLTYLLLTASYIISNGCDSSRSFWSAFSSKGLVSNIMVKSEVLFSEWIVREDSRQGMNFSSDMPVTSNVLIFVSNLYKVKIVQKLHLNGTFK